MLFPEQTLPLSVEPSTVVAPTGDLFQRRAARLRQLAPSSGTAEWLNWLAVLADAQHAAMAGLADAGPALPADFDWQSPVFAGAESGFDAAWADVYDTLRQVGPDLPPSRDAAALLPAARALLAGAATTGQRTLADVVVAAAQQVVHTHAAARLILPKGHLPLADRHACPCCGSAPVGAIVLAEQGKGGLRYLECSLCATRWNAVRARCTLCDDPGVVAYFGIEDAFPAVRAEACDHCHGYIKLYFQKDDRQVEPLIDDLASLAIDVLVGEQGYARGAPNPFLLAGEAVDG